MKRGRILAAGLGIAAMGMLALGMGTTAASADPYCGPGYHWYAGYCYPNPRVYYAPPPPVYYPAPAPVVVAPVAPTFGITFGFGPHGHR